MHPAFIIRYSTKTSIYPQALLKRNNFFIQPGTCHQTHIFLQQEWNIVQLPPSIEVEVLRIIQESLNNIRKHSQAHTVRVILRSTTQGDCQILIEDDGVGIDSTIENDTQRDHYGLNIMTERARRINGEFKIESDAGEGTRITLHFNHPTASHTGNNINSVTVQPPSRQIGL